MKIQAFSFPPVFGQSLRGCRPILFLWWIWKREECVIIWKKILLFFTCGCISHSILPLCFLPHVTVDNVPLGTWDSCFFTSDLWKHFVFFSLWVDTTYLSNTPALVLCQDPTFVPPEGTCVVVMMDFFFFLMQNTVLKFYKLESDPLKKLYKQL